VTDWLELMLDEVRRKQAEQAEAAAEKGAGFIFLQGRKINPAPFSRSTSQVEQGKKGSDLFLSGRKK
jgi:hypothetical protein